ncbi:MAG TPA: hypothetical protein VK527_03735 [Candidatus Limnocylindrales bacterium]|nr:hypothetical protein [Candidatus Limnocylindrales bacterium]
MYIVRDSFKAKPGMASKLAAMFKDVMSQQKDAKVRILTDYVGPYNSVIMEFEVPDLAAFEKRMKEYSEGKDIREKMKGYTDMYLSGGREIYRVM